MVLCLVFFMEALIMIAPVSALLRAYSDSYEQRDNTPTYGQPTEEAQPKSGATAANGQPLTEQQQKRIDELKRIDAEVRAHESAHAAAAGGLARGTSFRTTTGPDGKSYAIGGEVKIDISPVAGNPKATLAKMQTVRRAALAPTDPSGQDRAVAAQATAIEAQAQSEIKNTQTTSKSAVNTRTSPSNAQNSPLSAYHATKSLESSTYSAVEICTVCHTSLACNHLSAQLLAGFGAVA